MPVHPVSPVTLGQGYPLEAGPAELVYALPSTDTSMVLEAGAAQPVYVLTPAEALWMQALLDRLAAQAKQPEPKAE